MKGNDKIIDLLNANVTAERVAIHAYILKSKILENWGYEELAGTYMKRAHEEMRHLDALLERILFLGGPINMTGDIGKCDDFDHEIGAMLEHDHQLELGAIKAYNQLAEEALTLLDHGSRALAEKHVQEEEAHCNWLEDQIQILKDVGKPLFLQEAV